MKDFETIKDYMTDKWECIVRPQRSGKSTSALEIIGGAVVLGGLIYAGRILLRKYGKNIKEMAEDKAFGPLGDKMRDDMKGM